MTDDGKIVIELVGKDLATQQFVRSLGEMKSSMTSTQAAGRSAFGGLGSAAMAAGTAILGLVSTAKLLSTLKEVTAMEAALLKMASRLNTSVEILSSLGMVARKAGMDAEAFNMALQRMDKNISNAAKGVEQGSGKFDEYGEEVGKGGSALREMGLKAEVLVNLPLDQKLLALSAAMFQNVAPANQLRLALELGGRSAGAMVVVLKEGPEAMQKWIDRQIELGTITTDMAKRGAAAKTASGDLTESLGALGREAVDVAAPGITAITNALVGVLVRTREFNQQIELMRKLFGDAAAEKAKLGKVHVGDPAGVGFWGEAAETFYGPSPEQPYKKAITKPSIDPGDKAGAGGAGKSAREEAQTVVTLFDQMAWAADDAEKELAFITKHLETMSGYQQRLVSGQGEYAATMAGLSPLLSDQIKWKEQAIQKEMDLKLLTLDRELDEVKINQAIYDQEKGMIALVTQGKKLNLEKEKWATQGIGGGIQLFAAELRQESATAVAFGIRDGLKGAKGYADQAITDLIMSPFTHKKISFKQIGLDIANSLVSGMVKTGTTKLFSFFIDGAMGMVDTWKAAQVAMTGASMAGEAARLGAMASGASQGIGILGMFAKLAILKDAGQAAAGGFKSVMESVPFPFNIALAPIVAAAAFAATLAFGSGFGGGGYNATGNMAYGGPSPYHTGGHLQPIFAHAGWPLGPHEVPFIGLDTERVLSPRQTRDYEAGMREGGGVRTQTIIQAPTNITINPRQEMTQHDVNRGIRKWEKALKRKLGRGSRGLE